MQYISLEDLNFYYPYLRDNVITELIELNIQYTDDIVQHNIRKQLSYEMKNQKILKDTISKLRKKM